MKHAIVPFASVQPIGMIQLLGLAPILILVYAGGV